MFFRFRENIVIPNHFGPPKILSNEEKMIESAVESCFFKSFMACVLGNLCKKFNSKKNEKLKGIFFRIWFGSSYRSIQCVSKSNKYTRVSGSRKNTNSPWSVSRNASNNSFLRKEFCTYWYGFFGRRMHHWIGNFTCKLKKNNILTDL